MAQVAVILILQLFLSGTINSLSAQGNRNIKNVPQDFSTIQKAIDSSANGDTVLVASGVYKENINFRGKNIVVTSHFSITGDPSYINNTVIDGSNPVHPDTASCVLIISGEDSSAVLQGFTLTGGKGTRWLDEHGAGTYTEGGAILVTQSSPIIQYNLIVNNEAIHSPEGTVSAGGGAIRCGDSSPRIYNNIIFNNRGMYGGGIVLNYCSDARIYNNIINGNQVYQAVSGRPTFGGGGLWILESLPGNDLPNIITNNTITGNSSNSIGSGIRIWNAHTRIRNNIVWYNIQSDSIQIHLSSANSVLEYNNIQNIMDGTGNISLWPSFADSSFLLEDGSPCIDGGDPDNQYNDGEDESETGQALWPSKGSVRNDMGAYGGPKAYILPDFSSSKLFVPDLKLEFVPTFPGKADVRTLPLLNVGSYQLVIENVALLNNAQDIKFINQFPLIVAPNERAELLLEWMPQEMKDLSDTLAIYTNERFTSGYKKISLSGTSYPSAYIFFDEKKADLGELNPESAIIDTVFYVYNYGTATDSVSLEIGYERVRPDSAMTILPLLTEIAAKDSVAVTVSIYPSRIRRSAFTNEYKPFLIIESLFSTSKNRFSKQLRFELADITAIDNITSSPDKFGLKQNYPNPFNPTTTIEFSLPKSEFAELKVFNTLGKEVSILVSKKLNAGSYTYNWDAFGFASGIYYYHLKAGNFEEVKKMILVK